MIIAEYVNRLWIQINPAIATTNIFNYLVSKGNTYVEVSEYFLKNYGIAVSHGLYFSDEDGVKLQLILKDKTLDAKTLYSISADAIFGSDSDWTEEKGEYSYSFILLNINQTVEQL